MNLKILNKNQLDQRMRSLAQQERDVLCEILLTIKEIDCRRTYLELGFPSLFDYLTKSIGYSEGSAQRRIDAARLLHEVPELASRIQSGEIKLNQISLIQKASREVVRTQSIVVSAKDKLALAEQVVNLNHAASQLEVASFFDLPIQKETHCTVQANESVRVELTLSKEVHEKIKHAQELISHSLPSTDLVQFLEFVSERIIKQKTSVRSGSRNEKSASEKVSDQTSCKTSNEVSDQASDKDNLSASNHTNAPVGVKGNDNSDPKKNFNGKSVAATVAVNAPIYKKVLLNQKCCQFKNKSGKQCGSRWHLQVDHIQPRWAGGGNEIENLQVLCAQHNRLKYRMESGLR